MPAKNARKPWTSAQVEKLRDLVKHNTPTRLIAYKLGRTEEAIRAKAKALKLSLAPWNQPPYGEHK